MNGREGAAKEMQLYSHRAVSIVTWIETLVGAKDERARAAAHETLSFFDILEVSFDIADRAVRIRQEHRMALPDAIIWATARSRGTLLITRNERDFPSAQPDIRIPYRL